MEKNYEEDGFLAKWANGTLTEKENAEFKNTKDQDVFEAILKGTEILEVPSYDSDALYQKMQQRKSAKRKKAKVIRMWPYAAAASVAILVGSLLFFNNTTRYRTGAGQNLEIMLPDGSQVVLNAMSELDYDEKDWANQRTVTLSGEGYFKVQQGSTFTVDTQQGSVTVLGTQFTTNSRDGFFEVNCYEGKVKVSKEQRSEIIEKGQALRFMGNTMEKWAPDTNGPSWVKGESTFSNAPLTQVIIALENQYGVEIDDKNVAIETLRFTGGFAHTNLQSALQVVFGPFGIEYEVNDQKVMLSE
jgi:ferric-dicitrate binding protein FerR (iron transport regulator)